MLRFVFEQGNATIGYHRTLPEDSSQRNMTKMQPEAHDHHDHVHHTHDGPCRHADHRPVGAYDLADRISPAGGRRLAPISIYRALDFLVEQGFVHRLSSKNAYIACLHGHGANEVVAFLICESCGGVDEDSSPAMKKAVAAITETRQFSPSHQVVEIVGRCEHCRNAGS